jgi:hypothetical protein
MDEIKEQWMEGLAAKEQAGRARAAAEIYRVGCARADGAVAGWWQNRELAELRAGHGAATVGLAVSPARFARIREANGFPPLAAVPPEQDASEFPLHFPNGIALDVLTTREPGAGGAIARFLARQGEGLQQVEFRCGDVDRATAILREQFGIEPVYPAKRPGADGSAVNFYLVAGAEGKKVLIELYETTD